MYRIKVITPSGVQLDNEVKEVYIPTPNGVICVNQNHTELISVVKKGELRLKGGDFSSSSFSISEGIAEIKKDCCIIVISTILEN